MSKSKVKPKKNNNNFLENLILENKSINEMLERIQADEDNFHKLIDNKMKDLERKEKLKEQQNAEVNKIINNKLAFKFNQAEVIKDLDSKKLDQKTLKNINRNYHGLCEIISNYVILNDLLGKSKTSNSLIVNEDASQPENDLPQISINISKINKKEIRRSHILETTNIFAKLLAVFFDIYPHSIVPNFSDIVVTDKNNKFSHLNHKYAINKEVLQAALEKVSINGYVKFFAFKKTLFFMQGHSMLIKKTGDDQYSFFDPNHGEYQKLSLDELCDKLNYAMYQHGANKAAFIDAHKYIKDCGLDKKEEYNLKPSL